MSEDRDGMFGLGEDMLLGVNCKVEDWTVQVVEDAWKEARTGTIARLI